MRCGARSGGVRACASRYGRKAFFRSIRIRERQRTRRLSIVRKKAQEEAGAERVRHFREYPKSAHLFVYAMVKRQMCERCSRMYAAQYAGVVARQVVACCLP